MKRDAMVFPFRWVDSLLELEDDLPVMLVAIREYAENGTEPNFKGALAALWREYKGRIDHDLEAYGERCEKNRDNAKKRWDAKDATACNRIPKDATASKRMRNHAKNADVDVDVEVDNLKESVLTDAKEKPDASAPPSSFDRQPKKETFVKSFMMAADFSKWGEAEFRASVAEAVKAHPEYATDVEDFARYWLEPDKTGKPRFALQKTWATAGRLATWHQRSLNDRNGSAKPSGFYRDPKTGIVTGTGDEESYAEWKRNGGF